MRSSIRQKINKKQLTFFEQVSTLIPSEETEFTEYDWLLGNHSDELTPWIPVMALQSSVRRASKLNLSPVRYWVLPCCPFSFFSKFQRSSGDSRYAEYLRYVQQVGRTCGYTVEEDRMRIPSTRRTCFVGSIQIDADWSSLLRAKADMIAAESRAGKATDVQALEFTPRPAVEPIRNCTRIDRSIKDRLVDLTAKCLLIAGTCITFSSCLRDDTHFFRLCSVQERNPLVKAVGMQEERLNCRTSCSS